LIRKTAERIRRLNGKTSAASTPPVLAASTMNVTTHLYASVLDYACRLGLEGIVSKRVDAPYRSGPSKTWLKSKNPAMERARCLPLRLAASQKD